jgi:hypothetical protein
MTLIVGIHVSGVLCLAADTRITVKRHDGSSEYDDTCLKLEHVAPRIVIAGAGSVPMIQRMLTAIKKSVAISLNDPTALRSQLETIVVPEVDAFLASGRSFTDARCCLVFAGTSMTEPTSVQPEAFRSALIRLEEANLRNLPGLVRNLLDPRNAANRQVLIDSLQRSGPHLRPQVLDALARRRTIQEPLTLPLPGTQLFALEVRPPGALSIVDAGWGETLVFGSDTLSLSDTGELAARIEFSSDGQSTEKTLLTAAITDVSEKHSGVGGGVVTTFLSEKGFAFMLGRVWGENRPGGQPVLVSELERHPDAPPPHRLVMRSGGVQRGLIPMSVWTSSGSASLWA